MMTGTEWNPLHGTDWEPLLGQEFGKQYSICLQKCIEQERSCYDVYPSPDQVFAALRLTQCSETKVVIVGQDPYFRPGLAHGLACSVPRGVKPPRSLRNILLELRDDGCPETDLDQGNLQAWAARGVLLLNTTLTVREGVPGSHSGMGWETFTDRVIQEVERASSPVFMLWGKEAQKKRSLLENTPPERIIESSLPAPQSARRGPKPFLESHPFSRANEALSNAGREPIDWCLE